MLDKERITLEIALTDKTLVQIASKYGVSVSGVTRQIQRILFMIRLCWKGETHVFYRHSRTRAKALQQAKRALEKKLGLIHKSLSSQFALEFESVTKVIPCICYTCRHQKDKACPETGDGSALHYCIKWEWKR